MFALVSRRRSVIARSQVYYTIQFPAIPWILYISEVCRAYYARARQREISFRNDCAFRGVLTRLSIKRNDFAARRRTTVSGTDSYTCDGGHSTYAARCARHAQNRKRRIFASPSRARRISRRMRGKSRGNTINDVHSRELDFRLRQRRTGPFVSPRMKEHVGVKVEEGNDAPRQTSPRMWRCGSKTRREQFS